MNILFEEFPKTVRVNGESFLVETDFREWIRFIQLIDDAKVPWQIKCRLLLQWYIDGIPDDLETAVYALGDFLMRVLPDLHRSNCIHLNKMQSVFTVHSERCMELICRRFRICTGGSSRHCLLAFRKRQRSNRELCTGA